MAKRPAQPASKVGTNEATVKALGTGSSTYHGVDFNGRNQLIELFMLGSRAVGVARTYVKGRTLSGPVPTCLSGGNPPAGCPFDELTLLANKITIPRITVGARRSRRNFITTEGVSAVPEMADSGGVLLLGRVQGSGRHETAVQVATPRQPADAHSARPR